MNKGKVFLPDTLESKATRVSQDGVGKRQRGRQTGIETWNKEENGYKKELGKGMQRKKQTENLLEKWTEVTAATVTEAYF